VPRIGWHCSPRPNAHAVSWPCRPETMRRASRGTQAAGVAATIVMPRHTRSRRSAARRPGARVVLHGDTVEEAAAHAREMAARDGLVFIHHMTIRGDGGQAPGAGNVAGCAELDALLIPLARRPDFRLRRHRGRALTAHRNHRRAGGALFGAGAAHGRADGSARGPTTAKASRSRISAC